MELLPLHIFEKIFYEAINIEECDLEYNKNLRLVCKYWNNAIPLKNFWKLYSKKILVNDGTKNSTIFNHITKLIKNNNKIILKSDDINYNRKLLINNVLLKKMYQNDYFIIRAQIQNFYLNKIPDDLFFFNQMFNIFNLYIQNLNIVSLPVCYFKNSKCIDNLCDINCANNYHGLLEYTNHYLSRGIDDKGRFYLLFFYKDFGKNMIYYEFIYTIKFLNTKMLLTYSGYNNKCYIGNLSYNIDDNANDNIFFKRIIKFKSLNYIKRLINFNKCGIIEYEQKTDKFLEYEYIYEDNINNDLDVSLYFDKKEIESSINYNNYLYNK